MGAELDRFVAVRYDADRGEGEALATRYGVRGYPTFVVVDGSGRKQDEFAGFREPGPFIQRLRLYH